MTQTSIPFLFMRGGSSRGPYMNRADLPEDLSQLGDVLIALVGSGHPLNIDGIGGGNAVTTKVAMLSRSDDDWADIDYFFAQVSVEDRLVDFKPTCGNIMTAVGPAALEMGLIEPKGDITDVNIRAVNTDARVVARIQTPHNIVCYDGDVAIDGVPGTAAPVELNFMDVAGSKTGALLPTGSARDIFDGIEVTCMDVAMPMCIARASDFGLTGHETREELDANRDFFAHMEPIRIQAGEKMGMGDCTSSVTPKFGLLAPHPETGHIVTRYFMPWDTHPTMAVTGSQCLASCALTPGTIADGMMTIPVERPARITLHHPMGEMDVIVDFEMQGDSFIHKSAGLIRTARKLAAGEAFIPASIWSR
ncbi:MAG: 4-oxalomesaconate tautomerase [Alphaproteobacteria bacterium]|jgi:4-oxalomesaconate tautomerase|nr:4-oxalomesaconate tautomerase [Alphaproteobacteria bacterium]MBT5729697.1 4-oxalomesaconate tautomerase [Alphaproteobacteria bacterium]